MHQDELTATDYLTETLQTEEQARLEIFYQMLHKLEQAGQCRYVYHRLGKVLFGEKWIEE